MDAKFLEIIGYGEEKTVDGFKVYRYGVYGFIIVEAYADRIKKCRRSVPASGLNGVDFVIAPFDRTLGGTSLLSYDCEDRKGDMLTPEGQGIGILIDDMKSAIESD